MRKLGLTAAVMAAFLVTIGGFAGEKADETPVSNAEGPITFINLYDLEGEAREVMSQGAFGYVQGGAEDEVTLENNTAAFDRKQIVPNGMAGIDGISMKTRFLGVDLPSPIILAPMAAHGLAHQQADKATIRGTQKAGTLMGVATYASVLIRDIAQAAPGAPFYFQIYMTTDNGFNEFIAKQAKEAGARAIVITVDSGTAGNREADERNGFTYSSDMPNLSDYYQDGGVTQSQARAMRKISFTADDIRFMKEVSGLPVLVKGILSPDAADAAIAAGADGIWVSNHGGRQLDGAPATFDILPLIVERVAKRVPIVLDSGVRRGTHVFKALASGADIVAIGRPALYGLALGGSEGVSAVFEQLNKELETTMILAGTPTIEAVKEARLFDPVVRRIDDPE